MSFHPAASIVQPRLAPARVATCYRNALGLWRRAPLMLPVIGLCSLLLEALLQTVPWAGVAFSKAVVPMALAGLWLGLDELRQGGRLRFSSLWAAWCQPRWRSLWLLSASVGLTVFGFQLACAWLAYGHGVVDAVLFGHPQAHRALLTRRFEYVLLLPGLLPMTFIALALPLFLFRNASVWQAIAGSARAAFAAPLVFLLWMLPQAALLALCLSGPWAMLLLLLFVPLNSTANYALWRDIGTQTGIVAAPEA